MTLVGYTEEVRPVRHVPTGISILVRHVVDGVAPAGLGRYAWLAEMEARSPDGRQQIKFHRRVELPLPPTASTLDAVAYVQQHMQELAQQAQREHQAEVEAHRRKLVIANSVRKDAPFKSTKGRA